MTVTRRALLALLVIAVVVAIAARRAMTVEPLRPAALASGASAQSPSGLHWYKGNTHTHTLNSDGDSSPDDVVRWYREHGYAFLVLTDHNVLTEVDGLNGAYGASEQFLVIRGEEVTSQSADRKPVHVNGLEVQRLVPPPPVGSVFDMLQRSVDGIRQANGVPSVNHPNFGWAITPDDLRQLERTKLFEVFNGHPQTNNLGGGGAPGLEEVWDRVLSSGRLMYGIAVDDAHTFKKPGDPAVAGPGRGWVVVRAPRLDARALVDALERGDFYASTGVELSMYESSSNAVALDVKADSWSRFRVRFIGRNGRVLDEQTKLPARYVIRGDEGYVRAHVLESNGRQAWTQPVPAGTDAPH